MELIHIIAIVFVALLAIAVTKDTVVSWLYSHPKIFAPMLLIGIGALAWFGLSSDSEAAGKFINENFTMLLLFVEIILMFVAIYIKKVSWGIILLLTSLITLFAGNIF